MAEQKKPKVELVRVIVRVHIPSVDPGEAGGVHAAITEAVSSFPAAEIELSIMPKLPIR